MFWENSGQSVLTKKFLELFERLLKGFFGRRSDFVTQRLQDQAQQVIVDVFHSCEAFEQNQNNFRDSSWNKHRRLFLSTIILLSSCSFLRSLSILFLQNLSLLHKQSFKDLGELCCGQIFGKNVWNSWNLTISVDILVRGCIVDKGFNKGSPLTCRSLKHFLIFAQFSQKRQMMSNV